MSGHTPGPWEVGGQSGNPGEGLEIAAKGKFIAWGTSTYNEDEDEDVITDEDRDNARLIAAAPELLAALKLLVDEASWLGWDCSHITPVINKAEGKVADV
jgi:hypothetical protein